MYGAHMARSVFFSFHFDRDSWRVGQVRNSGALRAYSKSKYFTDKAGFEAIKRQGEQAVKRWIDEQMAGTSVTVVLIGKETASRRWVKYEIQQSIAKGKGLLGVQIGGIKNQHGETDSALGPNPLPSGVPVYKWNKDGGAQLLGEWVERAAQAAGR